MHTMDLRQKRSRETTEETVGSKKKKGRKRAKAEALRSPCMDDLPADIALLIMRKVAATASCPKDFVSARCVSRRWRSLCSDKEVRKAINPAAFPRYEVWCPHAHAFVIVAAKSDNIEACYFLGTIEFYCFGKRFEGISLLAQAAESGHPEALYALAIMHFNASGAESTDRNLAAGVLLCVSAAQRGHVAALRELGHCLQDGYGVRKNVVEGRRLLLEANLRECYEHAQLTPSVTAAEYQSLPLPPDLRTHLRNLRRGSISVETVRKADRAPFPRNPVAHSDVSAATSSSVAPPPNPQILPGVPVNVIRQMVATPLPTGQLAPLTGSALSQQTLNLVASLRDQCDVTRGQYPSQCTGDDACTVSATMNKLGDCLGPLLSDFGCVIPQKDPHRVSVFLLKWFTERKQNSPASSFYNLLKVCGNRMCSRPETRAHEFRCCAVCSEACYCSRGCQALDWKAGHMAKCQAEMAARAFEAELLAGDGDELDALLVED